MNLEAPLVVGGSAVLIALFVSVLVIWRDRKSRDRAYDDAPITRTGLAFSALNVLLLVTGVVLWPPLSNFQNLAYFGAYMVVLAAVMLTVTAALAKHGHPIFRRPPNYRIERTRDK